MTSHKLWIAAVLKSYYDPLYEYQLAAKRERVVFRGNVGAVYDWLQQVWNSA
jgi:tRNA 2-selenouridine synthase